MSRGFTANANSRSRGIGWILLGSLAIAFSQAHGSGRHVCVRKDTALVATAEPAAVRVYNRIDGKWELGQTLREGGSDRFGESLDLDGEVAVIGSPVETAVYVYRLRKDGDWQLEQRIQSDDKNNYFGGAVSVSGDTIVIGNCERWQPNIPGTSVFVYRIRDGEWRLQQTLKNPQPKKYNHFGFSICVDRDVLAVGARGHRAVSIFRRRGGEWQLEQSLTEPELFRFGQSVSLAGDRLVVGALGSKARVVTYLHAETGWRREGVLKKPSDVEKSDTNFGYCLDFDGSTAVVGSFRDFSSVYSLADNSWSEAFVIAPKPRGRHVDISEQFVSVSGDTIMISTPELEAGGKKRPPGVVVVTLDGENWETTQFIDTSKAAAEAK